MSLVALSGIGRSYRSGGGQVEALRDVSLSIEAGESVAIVGPSGSGKSTLLGIMGCLEPATSGRCLIAGQDVSRLSVPELAHLRGRILGFVFQSFNLLPRLTALENVELPLVYAGRPRRERRAEARGMLELVGLGARMHHLPAQLSGGQQQRVAIARALVNRPELILADEPTGALDSATGQDILGLLDEVNRRGTALVIVTHDPAVARRMRRCIEVRDGTILADSRDPAPGARAG